MFVGAKWHGARRDGLDAVATVASGRRGISHVPTDGCRFQRGTGRAEAGAAAFLSETMSSMSSMSSWGKTVLGQ